MSLRDQLSKDLKEAMRAKAQKRLSTIRLLQAAITEREIAARGEGRTSGLTDAEIQALIQTMIKQRRDSVTAYQEGGRADLAAGEQAELEILQSYLPEPLSEAALATAIQEAIRATDAQSMKDMGAVMAELKAKHAGRFDNAKAAQLVKSELSG